MQKSNILMLSMVMLLFPQICFAYIDPASGSLAIQMAIAFIIGGLFTVKMFWQKIVRTVKGFFGKTSKEEDTESEE